MLRHWMSAYTTLVAVGAFGKAVPAPLPVLTRRERRFSEVCIQPCMRTAMERRPYRDKAAVYADRRNAR